MSYELDLEKQEYIRNEAIKNGAHYCSECKYTKSTIDGKICLIKDSPYKFRMDNGNEIYNSGLWSSMLDIENIITKQFPCEFGENK